MKNSKILLAILVILIIAVGYGAFSKKVQVPVKTIQYDNPDAGPETEAEGQMQMIGILVGEWGTFSIEAGERNGDLNRPDKVQIISWDKMFVHYNIGSNSYISLVQYQDGSFGEIENLGKGDTIPKTEWQVLVNKYGYENYPPANYKINYETDQSGVPVPVSENLFVKIV